jgi:hypothetical protein
MLVGPCMHEQKGFNLYTFYGGMKDDYTWIDEAPAGAIPMVATLPEEFANGGTSQARSQRSTGGNEACHSADFKPAVQLSSSDVRQQLQLIRVNGLLGSGATAFVHKCLWPVRFGRTRLLAAKVRRLGVDLINVLGMSDVLWRG